MKAELLSTPTRRRFLQAGAIATAAGIMTAVYRTAQEGRNENTQFVLPEHIYAGKIVVSEHQLNEPVFFLKIPVDEKERMESLIQFENIRSLGGMRTDLLRRNRGLEITDPKVTRTASGDLWFYQTGVFAEKELSQMKTGHIFIPGEKIADQNGNSLGHLDISTLPQRRTQPTSSSRPQSLKSLRGK